MQEGDKSVLTEMREASRTLVRELGFLKPTLAGTDLAPSAVHAIVEIGRRGPMTAKELGSLLGLEKSSISRLLQKLIERGELEEEQDENDARNKLIVLSRSGRRLLRSIDQFADHQVRSALQYIPPSSHRDLVDSFRAYGNGLQKSRHKSPVPSFLDEITIQSGYRPGVVGRIVEMHASYYSSVAGFGQYFESKVASGLSDFVTRLSSARNGLWTALQSESVKASIAIDAEDLTPNVAHLRWFIVDDGLRGLGIGRRLLNEAISFCDHNGFAETRLWTFRGLDAARKLYESVGFELLEECSGEQWGKEVAEQQYSRKCRG